MNNSTDYPHPPHADKNQIELFEILRIIWKWKYLILAGTVAFAVIIVLISFNRPKIYRINVMLQPGVIGVNEEGQKIYVDDPRNMKAIIDDGTFNSEIRDYLEELQIKNRPNSLKFRVKIQREFNVLKVNYETQFVETGKKILNYLPELLREYYARDFQYMNDKHERNIISNLAKIENLKDETRLDKIHINNIEDRLRELELNITFSEKRNASLINDKNGFLRKGDESDSNKILLYNNLIQHNLELINQYKDKIIQFIAEKYNIEIQLKKREEEIVTILWEIEDLKKQKNSEKYINVLQSPTVSQDPIKPKPKVALIISSVTGLFMMIFVAGFLEYIFRHGRRKHQE